MSQSERPFVSVIVPIHNTGPHLGDCISSVLNQTFSDFELILINDGSTDNSKAVCDRMCRSDARVRLISYEENRGVSYARNKGIDSAIGKYLFFLDSDDMIHPMLLEEGVWQAEDTGADMVMVERFFSDEHSFAEWEDFCGQALKPEWHTPSEEELWENWGTLRRRFDVGGKLFLREAVSDLRFEETLRTSEDYLFNYSFLAETPRTVSYTNLPGYYYRVREDSVWHNLRLDGLMQTLRARRRIMESEVGAGREKNAALDERICLYLARDWYAENGNNDPASAEEIKTFFREEKRRGRFQKTPRTERWSYFLCIYCPGLFRTVKSVTDRRSDNKGEQT